MKKCIIFGAGEYRKLSWKRKNDDYVIAADGGYQKLMEIGEKPDLLIGDMDSLCDQEKVEAAKNQNVEVFVLPVCKDDTDMLAAIKIGLQKGYTCFEIYGGLGGRFDHSIANLQCLCYLQIMGAKGYLMDDGMCTELLCNERIDFSEKMQGYISVFAYGGDASGVTIRGLKYEITDADLTIDFPIGVSNEFVGRESCIEVKKGRLLLHHSVVAE